MHHLNAYQKLKARFSRHSHLQYLHRILKWDEEVMMPKGAGDVRARALATLTSQNHRMLVSNKTRNLLSSAENETLTEWDRVNFSWMQKLYKMHTAIPSWLIQETTIAQIACEQAWREKRTQNDWSGFMPLLEKCFALIYEISVRRADCLGTNPYDALLEEFAPNFNQGIIDPIFDKLKSELPNLIEQILTKNATTQLKPAGVFPVHLQKQLGLQVMHDLGFDFNLGRLDISAHPFCSGGPRDVRMTTRYSEGDFISALMAICHETGHGLYEQGLPKEWLEQPVGVIHSMAMHESQSLLIEMQVCRSLPFYQYLTPKLIQIFGNQPAFTAENLYHYATRVKRGFIRVDSDEVTYPLHVILRYELEKALFDNQLTIKDLPSAWDTLMQRYLNLSTHNNFCDGLMQDVHWAAGLFGYFPAYTLGRLMAAQFYAKYSSEHPYASEEICQGNFKSLHEWLTRMIYRNASFYNANELLQHVTGEGLNPDYFIEHIKQRYL